MSQGKINKPKPAEVAGGGSASTMSKMMRNMIESSPVGDTHIDLSSLPAVPMPSLQDIKIQIPAPGDVSEEQILQRFYLLCYQAAGRKIRRAGDKLQAGDEVLVDMLGYVAGKVLPASVRQNLTFVLQPDSIHPGFGNGLMGATVGDTTMVTTTFQYDDLVAGKASATAVFVVDVKGAAELIFPENMEQPAFLAKMNRGTTLEEIMSNISEEIADFQASSMVIQAMNEIMATLAKKVLISIPVALLDEEIRVLWSQSEGKFLAEKGISRMDQESALQGWLTHPGIRKDAEQRLKNAMIVQAFLRESGQGVEAEEIEGFVNEFAAANGIDAQTWRKAMADNDAEKTALVEKYLYMRTLSQIMEQVSVTYGS